MAELAHAQSDTAARLEAMIGLLAEGQSQLAARGQRAARFGDRTGSAIRCRQTTQHTTENLQKLHERLAVIDSAQKNITALATQVTSLQSVLANKQQRGAFGQGRMELIVRDGLPKELLRIPVHALQPHAAGLRVFLPDQRPLVIDAKFPLEAVTAYRDAKTDDERRQAAARVRTDIGKHVADIAREIPDPRRDAGSGADVRAVGIGLCRACTTASTTSCRRRFAPRS